MEVNRAPYELLLRVPGIGVRSARRILKARRASSLDFSSLKKLGVVLKRAQYFITCRGRGNGVPITQETAFRALVSQRMQAALPNCQQLSLFDPPETLTGEDVRACLTGQM